MFFISKRYKVQFFNDGKKTFLSRRIVWISSSKFAKACILWYKSMLFRWKGSVCTWGEFWNRLKRMYNRNQVLAKLQKACPLAGNNTIDPLAYLDGDQNEGAIVIEMKVPVMTDNITDYLHEQVVSRQWN